MDEDRRGGRKAASGWDWGGAVRVANGWGQGRDGRMRGASGWSQGRGGRLRATQWEGPVRHWGMRMGLRQHGTSCPRQDCGTGIRVCGESLGFSARKGKAVRKEGSEAWHTCLADGGTSGEVLKEKDTVLRDSKRVGRTLALHVADQGSIPSIPYGQD